MRAFQLRRAVNALHQGKVIAYPTEAVYGVGCDPDNELALIELFLMKRRPLDKGVILIAAEFNQLQDYIAPLAPKVLAKLSASWPGPHSWVVPAQAHVSDLITGGRSTVAVRVTAHPVASALCRAFGGPIVSTSANIHGLAPAVSGYQVRWQLPDVAVVVDGSCDRQAKPSSIRDALTGDIIR